MRTIWTQTSQVMRVSRMWMPGLLLVLVLTGAPLANASGLNVNSQVSFTPLTSTNRVLGNTTGCPAGFAGKFTFTAQLKNNDEYNKLPGLTVRVSTLSNGNVILNPQTNAVLGGVGAVMKVPNVGAYANGLLGWLETVDVPFVVCLKKLQPFQFFVSVFALGTQTISEAHTLLSANGRYVAFVSISSHLVPIPSGGRQVFVRDLETGATKLASVNLAGTRSANYPIPRFNAPVAISANGRYVAFLSLATDLVAVSDTNAIISPAFCDTCGSDVFVRDMETGTTMLASINRFGTSAANAPSLNPVISPDGRFVAFSSSASDLVPNDTNGTWDVFVRDLQTETTTLLSTSPLSSLVFSANGRFVAISSSASDLVPNDTNGTSDVFVRDLQTGTTTLVSVNRLGTDAGNEGSWAASISADGRFVTFSSSASDLVTNDINGTSDAFVRDLQMGTTTLVSVNRLGTNSGNSDSGISVSGSAMSANGRFVLFRSLANDLVATDSNGAADLFVRDLLMGTTTLVTMNRSGTDSAVPGDLYSLLLSALSADGRFVAFVSSSDLAGRDFNGVADGFVRDLQTGTTALATVDKFGRASGVEMLLMPHINMDGSIAMFGFFVYAVW